MTVLAGSVGIAVFVAVCCVPMVLASSANLLTVAPAIVLAAVAGVLGAHGMHAAIRVVRASYRLRRDLAGLAVPSPPRLGRSAPARGWMVASTWWRHPSRTPSPTARSPRGSRSAPAC